jgi:hypothetical protein
MKTTDKKHRNDENLRQVVDVLTDANYHAGRVLKDAAGSIELWVGPGKYPLIALQVHKNGDGFEVYVPLTQSNRMDETLVALRDATQLSAVPIAS